ncbi:hypothetical protein ABZ557_20760 [Streptomyces sp. NPDC019645]|uniref:hypothetical protein n=1 Tax=Streptomyces sp. NPDC019645 TaxID=3154786 RepID=UPI0033E9EE9E
MLVRTGGAAASGFFGGIAGIAVDRLLEGQQVEGALDRALYDSGQTLNDTMESTKAQTQESMAQVISEHGSTELTDDEAREVVRLAVEEGWTDSDSMMEDIRARPAA